MTFESYRPRFKAKVLQRLNLSARDVQRQAQRNLGGGGALTGSVRVIQVRPGLWRVGSSHPGAYAQEVGAYITPRGAKALKFNGRFAMHARIPAKRWLSRAGKQFARFAGRRLRGS